MDHQYVYPQAHTTVEGLVIPDRDQTIFEDGFAADFETGSSAFYHLSGWEQVSPPSSMREIESEEDVAEASPSSTGSSVSPLSPPPPSARRFSSSSTATTEWSASSTSSSPGETPDIGAVVLTCDSRKDCKYNAKEQQHEVKSGRAVRLHLFDRRDPTATLRLRGCLDLRVGFSADALRKTPLVADDVSCAKIKDHPKYEGDKPSMHGFVFRAWSSCKSDGSYYTDAEGHKHVRVALEDEVGAGDRGAGAGGNGCYVEFLCITEEIRRNKYWDLNVTHEGSSAVIKIPIQVMRELRAPCKKRKRGLSSTSAGSGILTDHDIWASAHGVKVFHDAPPLLPPAVLDAAGTRADRKAQVIERLLAREADVARAKYRRLTLSALEELEKVM